MSLRSWLSAVLLSLMPAAKSGRLGKYTPLAGTACAHCADQTVLSHASPD